MMGETGGKVQLWQWKMMGKSGLVEWETDGKFMEKSSYGGGKLWKVCVVVGDNDGKVLVVAVEND